MKLKKIERDCLLSCMYSLIMPVFSLFSCKTKEETCNFNQKRQQQKKTKILALTDEDLALSDISHT